MQHSFHASQIDSTLCMMCKRDETAHTIFATCECCSNVGECNLYMTMLMCAVCEAKEKSLQAASKAPENVSARLEAVEKQDSQISYTKFFNNNTLSIPELLELIEADDSIPQDEKKYELSKRVQARLKQFQATLIELSKQKLETELASNQLQIELNKLVPMLQERYRTEFAQSNINYKPGPVKAAKLPSKSFDKTELKKVALQFGIPEFILQTMVVQKKISIEAAARLYIKMNNAQDEELQIEEPICICSDAPGMCKIHPSN